MGVTKTCAYVLFQIQIYSFDALIGEVVVGGGGGGGRGGGGGGGGGGGECGLKRDECL